MLEVIREQFLIYGSMENYLTAGDLALIENRRGWNNGCYYGGDYASKWYCETSVCFVYERGLRHISHQRNYSNFYSWRGLV